METNLCNDSQHLDCRTRSLLLNKTNPINSITNPIATVIQIFECYLKKTNKKYKIVKLFVSVITVITYQLSLILLRCLDVFDGCYFLVTTYKHTQTITHYHTTDQSL